MARMKVRELINQLAALPPETQEKFFSTSDIDSKDAPDFSGSQNVGLVIEETQEEVLITASDKVDGVKIIPNFPK